MTSDQLPADARALLAAGRDRTGPDAATVARLRARVETAVVAGASTIAASATTKATASVSAIKSIAVKLVVVVASTSATAYLAHEVTARRSSNVEVAPILVMPRNTTDVSEFQPTVTVTAPEQVPLVPLVEEPAARAEEQAEQPAPSELVTNTPQATLAREIELVDRTTIALRGDDFDAALDALRTYDVETAGGGQLAQDAAALRVEVLCRTHDVSQMKELDAFVAHWPRSPQRSHLKAICTEESK
jgi:hypothetical protein